LPPGSSGVSGEAHYAVAIFPVGACNSMVMRFLCGQGTQRRDRDGFVVFVPDEPQMTTTYGALRMAGLREM
jgi:hypothetical protein